MRDGYRAERRFGVASPERMTELYRELRSLRAVAAALGVHASTVHDALKVTGEPRQPRGRPAAAQGRNQMTKAATKTRGTREALTAREVKQLEDARAALDTFESRLARVMGEGPTARFAISEVSRGLRVLVQGR